MLTGAAAPQGAPVSEDAPLLRARRERPRRRRPPEQRDELAASDHSITSSARSRNDSGIVSLSALAVVNAAKKIIARYANRHSRGTFWNYTPTITGSGPRSGVGG
jgi:hypothetical protein